MENKTQELENEIKGLKEKLIQLSDIVNTIKDNVIVSNKVIKEHHELLNLIVEEIKNGK